MDISPRLCRNRAKALRGIERQIDRLRARRVLEPLWPFEIALIGEALAEAGVAFSRVRAPLIPVLSPGEAAVPLDAALALLEEARACFAPPRAKGHARNRTPPEIPAHHGAEISYPRVRTT